MTQQDSGRDRLGRRAKRFLSPSQKYELWLQLVTGELSQGEAADRFGIDRSTVMRIRQVAEGLSVQAACRVLQVGERRVNRWQARRAAGTLADRPAGGGAVHGLLDEEVEAILELAEQWGEVDRSHRKLAHRGSRLGRVWV